MFASSAVHLVHSTSSAAQHAWHSALHGALHPLTIGFNTGYRPRQVLGRGHLSALLGPQEALEVARPRRAGGDGGARVGRAMAGRAQPSRSSRRRSSAGAADQAARHQEGAAKGVASHGATLWLRVDDGPARRPPRHLRLGRARVPDQRLRARVAHPGPVGPGRWRLHAQAWLHVEFRCGARAQVRPQLRRVVRCGEQGLFVELSAGALSPHYVRGA